MLEPLGEMSMPTFKNGDLNVKKLSKTLFNQLNSYMNKKARPLESAIFNYYFNDSSGDDILDSL